MTLPVTSMGLANFPEMYERLLVGPVFRPWAELLLDRLRPPVGGRLLDIACGTGIVARTAKERMGASALVVGVDVSEPMLTVARSVAPDIDWREGSADALPVANDATFDVVTCQQGFQLFSNKDGAVREMRRALTAGGRLGLSLWRPLEENPVLKLLHDIAETRVGPIYDRRHSWGDTPALVRMLNEGGFSGARGSVETLDARLADPMAFVRLNARALVGMSAASATMPDQERVTVTERIAEDSLPALATYVSSGTLVFPLFSTVVIAEG